MLLQAFDIVWQKAWNINYESYSLKNAVVFKHASLEKESEWNLKKTIN